MGLVVGTDCPELHEGSSHTQSMAEWAEKKSDWEGLPMGPGTAAFLGRLASGW